MEKMGSAIVPKRKGHVMPHRPGEEIPGLVRRQTEGRESMDTMLHCGGCGKGWVRQSKPLSRFRIG